MRTRPGRRLLPCPARWTAVFLLFVSGLSAQEPQPTQPIELPNEYWSALPRDVRGVFVGPDGRRWWQFPLTSVDVLQAKPGLAAAYKSQSPQIRHGDLALIEPGGRVWFYLDRKRLLGYDGRKWIEANMPANANDNFIGKCLSRGAFLDSQSNRFAGGAAWFVSQRAVHRYDGKDWVGQAILPEKQPISGTLCLMVSPNGRFAAAHAGLGAVWVFHDNRWESAGTALTVKSILTSFAVTDAGEVWLTDTSRRLIVYPIVDPSAKPASQSPDGVAQAVPTQVAPAQPAPAPAPVQPPADSVPQWVERLAASDPAQRDEAEKRLVGKGVTARSAVEEALRAPVDFDAYVRMQRVLNRLPSVAVVTPEPPVSPRTPVTSPPPTDRSRKIGEFTVFDPMGLQQDPLGRIYIAAQRIEGPSINGPGVLIVSPDGRHEAIAGTKWSQFFSVRSFPAPTPVLDEKRGGVWLSGQGGAPFFDRQKRDTTLVLPHGGAGNVTAVDDENHVFASGPFGQVMVLRTDLKDPRPQLPVTDTSLCDSGAMQVADDGAVWCCRRDSETSVTQLSRFDGRSWKVMQPEPALAWPIVSGKNGVVLVRNQKTWLLYRNDKLLGQGLLEDLVRQHRDAFVAAGQISGQSVFRRSTWLAIDRGGNLWARDETPFVRVLVGDRWIDVRDALQTAGHAGWRQHFGALVGDGSRVFLSDAFVTGEKKKSFLVEVKDGQLKFEEVPGKDLSGTSDRIFARDGSLWVSARPLADQTQALLRLSERGVVEKIEDGGRPLLVDKAENVWTNGASANFPNQIVRYRAGKKPQTIALPGHEAPFGWFSDAPGSVYFATALGLQRYVASGPDYDQFQRDQLFALPPGEYVHQLALSELGFVAMLHSQSPNLRIGVLKLPDDKKPDGKPVAAESQ